MDELKKVFAQNEEIIDFKETSGAPNVFAQRKRQTIDLEQRLREISQQINKELFEKSNERTKKGQIEVEDFTNVLEEIKGFVLSIGNSIIERGKDILENISKINIPIIDLSSLMPRIEATSTFLNIHEENWFYDKRYKY